MAGHIALEEPETRPDARCRSRLRAWPAGARPPRRMRERIWRRCRCCYPGYSRCRRCARVWPLDSQHPSGSPSRGLAVPFDLSLRQRRAAITAGTTSWLCGDPAACAATGAYEIRAAAPARCYRRRPPRPSALARGAEPFFFRALLGVARCYRSRQSQRLGAPRPATAPARMCGRLPAQSSTTTCSAHTGGTRAHTSRPPRA